MQKNATKSFIALENKYVKRTLVFPHNLHNAYHLHRMARLKERTLKLSREEYLKNQCDEDESLEITMEKVTCPKCRGDGDDSTTTHIQDLCPSDRKKITQLISELARCTQDKHKVTADLAVSKAENEALENQIQLLNSQQEDDKNKLRSQLSHTNAEMSKLKLQTSHSLKLLTEQIMALENQSSKLIETVKDLLNDKMLLEDTLRKQKMKGKILEAKVDELKKTNDTEKLLLLNQRQNNKCDKNCQTVEGANLEKNYTCPRLGIVEPNKEIHRLSKTIHVKSKQDLDEPSTEATLLRELFFKRPTVEENEGLDFFPKLPKS